MSPKNLTPHELTFLLMIICTSIIQIYSPPIANSLTLEMVRRDSFDFDLFPNNLSDFQKNRIFAQLSHSRSRRLSSQLPTIVSKPVNGSATIDTIQPPIKQFMDSLFGISLAIGSRPYNTYFVADTGSNIIWVQCQECKDCFPIKNGAFNKTASTSYRKIRFDDPLCQPRLKTGDDSCKLKITYGSGHVEGERALENLQFRSTNRGRQFTVPNLVLGCADSVKHWTLGHRNDGKNNVVSGIFGLALGHIKYGNSFMELTKNLTKMKFSYCLPSWTASKSKSIPLSFGDDVPRLPASAQSTPMMNSMYFLNVYDISVGGHRLNLDPSLFKRCADGRGGFVIDSGCGKTFLVRSAYEKVREALATILANQGKQPVEPPPGYRNLFCYRWPLKVKNPPSVTYHMENNADIEVRFEDLFIRDKFANVKKYFACLTFAYADDGGTNLLGAAHQADYRFVYDLDRETLHFQRDRC